MEETQRKPFNGKYKGRYTTVRDVYNKIKDSIRIKTKWSKKLGKHKTKVIPYSLFYAIVERFFKILIRDLVYKKELIHLPQSFGYVYMDKKKHKRPFHIRLDLEETYRTGKVVKCKVPILDDFYYKVMWMRPFQFSKCKIMPLSMFKRHINIEFKNK